MFAVLDSVLGLRVQSQVGILGESENQPSFYDPLKRLKSSMPYICPKPEKFLFLVVHYQKLTFSLSKIMTLSIENIQL